MILSGQNCPGSIFVNAHVVVQLVHTISTSTFWSGAVIFFVRTIGRKVSRACRAPLSLKLPSQPYSFSDNYDFFWFLLFLQGTVETISPQNLDQTLHDFFQPSLDHCNKSPWYLRGDFTIVSNIVMITITITNINSIIITKTRSIITALPKSLLWYLLTTIASQHGIKN